MIILRKRIFSNSITPVPKPGIAKLNSSPTVKMPGSKPELTTYQMEHPETIPQNKSGVDTTTLNKMDQVLKMDADQANNLNLNSYK